MLTITDSKASVKKTVQAFRFQFDKQLFENSSQGKCPRCSCNGERAQKALGMACDDARTVCGFHCQVHI